jgi:hypothetical protein
MLFPLLVSFDLGEIADGETPMSKLTVPLPDFPVTKFLEETNDHFFERVEQAIGDVVGRYAHGEYDVCIAVVPNMGHQNQVFEQAGVPQWPPFRAWH